MIPAGWASPLLASPPREPPAPPPPAAATATHAHAMLAASLKPAPFLAAFSPSARRSPAPSVAFPFPARLNQRPLLSAAATAEGTGASARQGEDSSSSFSAAAPPIDEARLAQFAADWEAARADKEQGKILTLPVLRANSGGLIVKFNSLQGFVPNPLLSPAHWCRDPKRPIQDVSKDLVGTSISVKVQEVYLTSSLDQEGIKKAVQRVLGRVP